MPIQYFVSIHLIQPFHGCNRNNNFFLIKNNRMFGRFVQPVPSEYKKMKEVDMVHLAHNWSQSNKSWKLVDFFIASSSQTQIAQRCFKLKMPQASLRLPLMLWEWSR